MTVDLGATLRDQLDRYRAHMQSPEVQERLERGRRTQRRMGYVFHLLAAILAVPVGLMLWRVGGAMIGAPGVFAGIVTLAAEVARRRLGVQRAWPSHLFNLGGWLCATYLTMLPVLLLLAMLSLF